MKYLDKPSIIKIAACHTCCARRGEPCTFSRADDPRNLRAAAGQSHLDRILRAREAWKAEWPSLDALAAQISL